MLEKLFGSVYATYMAWQKDTNYQTQAHIMETAPCETDTFKPPLI